MKPKSKALNLFVCMILIATAFTATIPDQTDPNTSFKGRADKKANPGIPLGPLTDSVAPEAVIHFEVDDREIVVYGVDDVDENVTVVETIIKVVAHKETIRYQLIDESGNLLDLLLEYKSRGGNIEVSVLRMIYNKGSPISPRENHYKIEFVLILNSPDT